MGESIAIYAFQSLLNFQHSFLNITATRCYLIGRLDALNWKMRGVCEILRVGKAVHCSPMLATLQNTLIWHDFKVTHLVEVFSKPER